MLRRQKHFSVLLAILLIAGFIVTSWLSYQVASTSIESRISNDTLPLTSDIIYSEIQHDLYKPIFISSIIAQETVIRDSVLNNEKNSEDVIQYLKNIQKKYNTVTSYFISDTTLNYYHPTGTIKKVSSNQPKDNWYFALKNTPATQAYEVNIAHDTVRAVMMVYVNYKVYDSNNNFIGAAGVGFALKTVKALIENYQQRYRRTIYFTDTAGNITLHGNALKNLNSLAKRIESQKLINIILNSTTTSLNYIRDEEKVYLNSRFIKEFNWYLIIEQDASSSEAKLNKTFQINIALSVLVTIGVLLIAHIAFNRYQSKLVIMASIDKLSGLLNREAFEPIINNNMEQAKRKNKPLSLILLDIDHFKQVNDTYGHLTGDKVIQHVANACKLHSRESDAVCRWGGEEFIIMLADTPLEGASVIANRIKTSLTKTNDEPKVTASFGITTYHANEQLDDFLNRADNALYQAKRNGRDLIEVIK